MNKRMPLDRVKRRAKELRKAPTTAEKILWESLRNRKLCGLKFKRQYPIGPCIVDFYSSRHKLVLELDGSVHLQQTEYDAERTAFLNSRGLQVIRIRNEEVENDLERVLGKIAVACGESYPSPEPGEGCQPDGMAG
jgi:very-short-patch-repair endonuclease